jgi:hypothetical protein
VLEAGETATLVATITPGNATHKTVTFTSSNAAVTVSSSVYNSTTGATSVTITGASVGRATITATTAEGNKTAECNVIVTEAAAPKPFVLTSSGVLNRSSGIEASAGIGPVQGIAAHAGQEVVVFQLMRGNTPVNTVSLERDITSADEFTSYFNVDPSDSTYLVKVYVLDSFSGDMTAPVSLANQITLN